MSGRLTSAVEFYVAFMNQIKRGGQGFSQADDLLAQFAHKPEKIDYRC